MSSVFRRASSKLLKILIRALDPGAVANYVQVYGKTVTGITQLFAQTSDGTVSQITPITAAGTALIGGASAAAQRNTLGIGGSYYGTGFDGDLTLDGATTYNLGTGTLGAMTLAPVANVYTLTRDLHARNLTINAGVELRTQGFGVFVTGTLTCNGTLGEKAGNGADGTAVGGGVGGTRVHTSSTRRYFGGVAGVNGSAGAGSPGLTGGLTTPATGVSGGLTADSTNGGVMQGGTGGRSDAGGAGSGGDVAANSYDANTSLLHYDFSTAITGRGWSSTQFTFGSSGGSGGGQGGGGGGGSGASGTGVGVFAQTITGSGTIRSQGGNGGNGFGAGGGGGGGSGGYLCIVSNTAFAGASVGGVTLSVAGGAKGLKGGTGASGDGGNGGDGLLVTFNP